MKTGHTSKVHALAALSLALWNAPAMAQAPPDAKHGRVLRAGALLDTSGARLFILEHTKLATPTQLLSERDDVLRGFLNARLVATRLRDGKVLWRSKARVDPIGVVGKYVVGLEERPMKTSGSRQGEDAYEVLQGRMDISVFEREAGRHVYSRQASGRTLPLTGPLPP